MLEKIPSVHIEQVSISTKLLWNIFEASSSKVSEHPTWSWNWSMEFDISWLSHGHSIFNVMMRLVLLRMDCSKKKTVDNMGREIWGCREPDVAWGCHRGWWRSIPTYHIGIRRRLLWQFRKAVFEETLLTYLSLKIYWCKFLTGCFPDPYSSRFNPHNTSR